MRVLSINFSKSLDGQTEFVIQVVSTTLNHSIADAWYTNI